MPREKPSADAIACECESFYCYSIAHRNRDDTRDIRAFEPIHESGIGLSEYLRDCAYRDEREGVMRTYLVRDGSSNEFVGYFSIKAGAISTNERAVGADGDYGFHELPEDQTSFLNARMKPTVSQGCTFTYLRL